MISVNSLQILLLPVIIILFIHNYLKFVVKIDDFNVKPIKTNLVDFTNNLKLNNELSKAKIIIEESVSSSVKIGNNLYLATTNGKIFSLNTDNNKLNKVASIDGEILSVRKLQSNQFLYILSASFGIYKLDLESKKFTTIYDHSKYKNQLNSSTVTHLSDFVILEEANNQSSFLIVQSSKRWSLNNFIYSHIEGDSTGQIIKFKPDENEVEIVLENLGFPKSLELSDDKKSVYITEFITRKILKLNLNDKTIKIISNQLPGEPNHIRRSSNLNKETYWLPIFSARSTNTSNYLDKYNDNTIVKEFSLYLIKGIEDFFEIINKYIYKNNISKRWKYYVKHSLYLDQFKHGLILQIDNEGNILNSLHSPEGKISNVEEVIEVVNQKDKKIYLQSIFKNYFAILQL